MDRNLSDSWTGLTKFTVLNEKPVEGHVWSGRRLTKIPATTRPDHLWTISGQKCGLACEKRLIEEEKQRRTIDKPKLDNAGKLRDIYFVDPDDGELKETVENARKS